MTGTFHESYSRDEALIGSSDRSFGIVMAAAFGLLSLLNWWHGGRSWPWTGGIAALCLAAALFYPAILRPFNRLWLKFALLLHKVMNPIVTAWAVGAALAAMHIFKDQPRNTNGGDGMFGSFLGPS